MDINAEQTYSRNTPIEKGDESHILEGNLHPLSDKGALVVSIDTKIRGMMFGIALGDALGLPVETWKADAIREEFGRVDKMLRVEANPFLRDGSYPKGIWSDDTQLSLVIASSIAQEGGISLDAIAAGHVAAYQESTLGWGGGTRKAVERLASGISWQESGGTAAPGKGLGNGVVMKIGPVAAWLVRSGEAIEDHLKEISALATMTHPGRMAVSSAFAHVAALRYCLEATPEDFDPIRFEQIVTHYSALGEGYSAPSTEKDDITVALGTIVDASQKSAQHIIKAYGGGGSYVFQSLPFSYAFFLRNWGSIDSMFDVISAGGDTDSNGSIVGALLGALHGENILPQRLLSEVSGLERVEDVVERFLAPSAHVR